MGTKLTAAQMDVLRSMASEPGEGWVTAQWVAEDNDHWWDTPWASSKIGPLAKRGFIEKGGRGWYRITPSGREALREASHEH